MNSSTTPSGFSLKWHRMVQRLALHSISFRILAVVSIIGTLALASLGALMIRDMEKNLFRQYENTILTLAEHAGQGLQTIMLAGYADIARNYSDNLRKVPGLLVFRILNRHGREAFRPEGEAAYEADGAILSAFKQAIHDKKPASFTESVPEGEQRTLMMPLLNAEPCHACHGSDHEVRGVFQLTVSLAEMDREISAARNQAILGTIVAVGLFLAFLGWYLARSLRTPLQNVSTAIEEVAGGNLINRIDASGRDEIAAIAHHVNQLKGKLVDTIRMINLQTGGITAFIREVLKLRSAIGADTSGIRQLSGEVSEENDRLASEIHHMTQLLNQSLENITAMAEAAGKVADDIRVTARNADDASRNVTTMAEAAEEMTANLDEVNNSLDQVSHSVARVARSIAEMTHSLATVGQRCEIANESSRTAHEHAQQTFSAVDELSNSANEIGTVVGIIQAIAEQTNMLALNAAIEAAGAGEAGKGFAVVANEVKALALQTGRATQQISLKIEEIQSGTANVVERVKEITVIVEQISSLNSEILEDVDGQHLMVRGISEAMSEVNAATATVTLNADTLHHAAERVSLSAAEAARGTSEIAATSSTVAGSAGRMAEQSDAALQFVHKVLSSFVTTERASETVRNRIQDSLKAVARLHGTVNHFHALGDVASNISDALYAAQSSLDIGPEPFDVRKLKEAILNVLGRLELAAHGNAALTLDELNRMCIICSWEKEKTPVYEGNPIFTRLREVHQQMHLTGAEIVARLGEHQESAATDALLYFRALQRSLFEHLDKLYLGHDTLATDQPLILWTGKMEVNVPTLDADHRNLIRLINELYAAVQSGQGQKLLTKIVDELLTYTRTHFAREERHMQEIGFPDLAMHQEEHRLFAEKATAYQKKLEEDPFALSSDVLQYLRSWLTQHIQGSDMAYRRHSEARVKKGKTA
ncbi:Bacteriohemerythrin [Candidatus Magnetaquicoccaceae bacterium FCR-1]|uniref:Bacteriohemerythrin n=1 Tax=Candidatus Magnetaquiglobus chichijimensis TaxID=3141448 RepID=A0ABQ0C6D5_9PROT